MEFMVLAAAMGTLPLAHASAWADTGFMRGAAMGSLPTLDCEGECSRYRATASATPSWARGLTIYCVASHASRRRPARCRRRS